MYLRLKVMVRADYLGSIVYFNESLKHGNVDASCNWAVSLIHLERYQEAVEHSARCVKAGDQAYRTGGSRLVRPGGCVHY